MFRLYLPTDLEKEISAIYQSIGIVKPSYIDEEWIASQLGIKLLRNNIPSQAFEKGGFRCIVLDSGLSKEQQREDFLHELGHLLRGHSGNQLDMPDLFRDLQEGQADQFVLYAAMPMYLIQKLEIPEFERDMPYIFASEFKVTIELARKRWDQIKRRISRSRWDRSLIEHDRNRYKKADPSNWCPEAKLMFRTAINRKMEKGQGVFIR